MKLELFSRRWGHADSYTVDRTEGGWNIRFLSKGGECDKKGAPHLFENLVHDSINYPAALGGYMEWLWNQAKEKNMSDEKIQENLNLLGKWISEIEKRSPGGIWRGYT